MKVIIFVGALILIFSLNSKAQDNLQQGINNYIISNAHSFQELGTKLVDEYGTKNIQFVKLENGRYVPVKANYEAKDFSNAEISGDVILIFAIIGAVVVAIALLRAITR